MAYTPTAWQDHVTDNSGNVIQQGTPVSAKNLNNMEQGIVAAHKQFEEQASQSRQIGHGPNLIKTDRASGADVVIHGRTLVNLLGTTGSFEADSDGDGVADGWIPINAFGVKTLDSINVSQGTKSQKVTAISSDTSPSRGVFNVFPTVAGDKYLVLFDVFTDGPNVEAAFYNSKTSVWLGGAGGSTNKTIYGKFKAIDTASKIYLYNGAAPGETGNVWFDGVRLYKIDEATYQKIDIDPEYTGDRLVAKYPYVDGIKHLEDFGMSLVGINQIPPVTSSAWILHSNAKVLGPYELQLNAVSDAEHSTCTIPVLPNTTYRFSWDGNEGLAYVEELDVSMGFVRSSKLEPFTTLSVTRYIRIFASNHQMGAGTFVFRNMMLVLGDNVPESFVPRNDDYLYLPFTLAEGDSFDSRLGTVTRFMKTGVIMDGTLPWGYNYEEYSGSKTVYCVNGYPSGYPVSYLEKWDGSILERADPVNSPGKYVIDGVGTLKINISNSESGWMDRINPSANAIKAFFNGWKANNTDGTTYTSWVSILDSSTPTINAEAWVAANKAPGWRGWGTLSYKVIDAVRETVLPEGSIGLHEGGNVLELLEGVVVRELVTPQLNAAYGVYTIGNIAFPSSRTKYRVQKFLTIFKDNKEDTDNWYFVPVSNAYGNVYADILASDFDPSAKYYVTYIDLDKYKRTVNAIAAEVFYKTNQKAVVDGLVQDMADVKTTASINARSLAEVYKRLKALGG